MTLRISPLSVCSDRNGFEKPTAIDDKLIHLEPVFPWTISESEVNLKNCTQVVSVFVVHTKILANELDSLQDVQDWKVEIKNSEGTTVPLLCRPDLVGYDPSEGKSDLIPASADWYFEIDPASGPFPLMLSGNNQISP